MVRGCGLSWAQFTEPINWAYLSSDVQKLRKQTWVSKQVKELRGWISANGIGIQNDILDDMDDVHVGIVFSN